MRIITDDEIRSLHITNEEYLQWASEMIKGKNKALLPAKISMKQPGHIFYNVMPCIIKEYNVAGIKVVNRYPEREPSIKADLLLYNYADGSLKAIIDATYITKMRTGAVAAHSILLLVNKGFKTISFIGLGNVTQATADILFSYMGAKKITVKLYRYKNHAERFIERYRHYQNLDFIICPTYEETIINSDVIVSGITYAEKDFCDDSCFKEGCLVVPIHTLGFQNCDLFFDKVFGDDYSHICDFKYFDKFKSFTEVCDVVNGIKEGRTNDKERIIAYNRGIAIHDIYFAHKIYNKYIEINQK
jgi:ornithine cyclodeaminase/alanine dehydrogenase